MIMYTHSAALFVPCHLIDDGSENRTFQNRSSKLIGRFSSLLRLQLLPVGTPARNPYVQIKWSDVNDTLQDAVGVNGSQLTFLLCRTVSDSDIVLFVQRLFSCRFET